MYLWKIVSMQLIGFSDINKCGIDTVVTISHMEIFNMLAAGFHITIVNHSLPIQMLDLFFGGGQFYHHHYSLNLVE